MNVLIGGLISYTKASNFGAPGSAEFSGLLSGADIADGGIYRINGSVAVDASPDIPVHRRVRLICAISGRLVRETWSDSVTGHYEFLNIRQGPWTVIAHDYSGVYNAVIADNLLATK